GKVAVLDPSAARLSEQQVADLQKGKTDTLDRIKADVLVQVQAKPTRWSEGGVAVRVLASAMNLKGGESIGRSFVDIPPPLDKPQINKFTRFLARKLMVGMLDSWSEFGGPPAGDRDRPAPDGPATRESPDTAPSRTDEPGTAEPREPRDSRDRKPDEAGGTTEPAPDTTDRSRAIPNDSARPDNPTTRPGDGAAPGPTDTGGD